MHAALCVGPQGSDICSLLNFRTSVIECKFGWEAVQDQVTQQGLQGRIRRLYPDDPSATSGRAYTLYDYIPRARRKIIISWGILLGLIATDRERSDAFREHVLNEVCVLIRILCGYIMGI